MFLSHEMSLLRKLHWKFCQTPANQRKVAANTKSAVFDYLGKEWSLRDEMWRHDDVTIIYNEFSQVDLRTFITICDLGTFSIKLNVILSTILSQIALKSHFF